MVGYTDCLTWGLGSALQKDKCGSCVASDGLASEVTNADSAAYD